MVLFIEIFLFPWEIYLYTLIELDEIENLLELLLSDYPSPINHDLDNVHELFFFTLDGLPPFFKESQKLIVTFSLVVIQMQTLMFLFI